MRQRIVVMRERILKAFTLVELLVVIAIIGILVALLLPAIQAAREAARRAECVNKMKQLGVALHNYHDTHSGFPPSQVANGDCTSIPYTGYTVMNMNGLVLLLPYLELQALHDEFDFNYAFDTRVRSPITSAMLAGGGTGPNVPIADRDAPEPFVCPSESYITSQSYRRRTNYDFVTIKAWNQCSNWMSYGSSRTMFHDGSNCRIRDILDGTSHTVAMAESRRETACNGSNAEWAQRGWVQVGLSLSSSPPNNTFRLITWGTNPAPPHNCNDPYGGARIGDWAWTGSFHPGGINVLKGDGSVRFLTNTADATLRTRLERIVDGNIVPPF